jgi:plastocyanin
MGRRRTTPRILDASVRILTITIFWPIAAMPAAPTPEATGRVEGRVTFQGAPPPLMTVGETGEAQPTLYIDAAGGLRYAVVYLPDARAAGPPATKPAIVNQRNFIFEPQVLAVRAGRMVRFTSDDVANHNVRAKGTTPVNTFFISTAPGSTGSATHAFGATPPDRPVLLSCDIHPWMAAWIYVFDHDAFAVTAPDGRFEIDDVRPGRYRVAVRQPSGPLARDLAIDVRAGTPTRLDVRFTGADLEMPGR